jgi:hypothetical protein
MCIAATTVGNHHCAQNLSLYPTTGSPVPPLRLHLSLPPSPLATANLLSFLCASQACVSGTLQWIVFETCQWCFASQHHSLRFIQAPVCSSGLFLSLTRMSHSSVTHPWRPLGSYKQHHCEHSYTGFCMSGSFYVSVSVLRQCNCWVTWWVHFYWKLFLPHCPAVYEWCTKCSVTSVAYFGHSDGSEGHDCVVICIHISQMASYELCAICSCSCRKCLCVSFAPFLVILLDF